MNEIILFLQALLLAAGWLLFLRAQQELKAQAAKQSLAGEADNLRRSIEALLQRLTTEAERIDRQLSEKIAQAQNQNAPAQAAVEVAVPPVSLQDERYAHIYALADKGVSPEQIAKDTGVLPGEIELILAIRSTGKSTGNARIAGKEIG